MTETTIIPISDIRRDGGTQSREGIDSSTVADYAEKMAAGASFPAVTVFYDGAVYWLADGFHRIAAATGLKLDTINADVQQGTQRDAILFSVGVNAAHGLRRSNDDKRRAVEKLLRDDEWRRNSDRWIAEKAGVDHKTVGRLRGELIQRGEIPQELAATPTTETIAERVETDKEYPPDVSPDPDVEAARQIALRALALWPAETLDQRLENGEDGDIDGALYRLGKGSIPVEGGPAQKVGKAHIAVRVTTTNGTGVYRFFAHQLTEWMVERDALVRDPKTIGELYNLTYAGRADYYIGKQLAKYGLTFVTRHGRDSITPSGKAVLDSYIAAHPLLTMEVDIRLKSKIEGGNLGTLETLLRGIYKKQAKPGKWVPVEYGSSWDSDRTLSWLGAFVKRGLLVSQKRPKTGQSWGEKTISFFAMTDAGCELIGSKPLPEPEALPNHPYHIGAKTFVPEDAAFSVKVGDFVKVRGSATIGKVVELGKWPNVSIREPGKNWNTSAYDSQLEVLPEEGTTNRVALRELDVQTGEIARHIEYARKQAESWICDDVEPAEGYSNKKTLLRRLYAISQLLAGTLSGQRLNLEASQPKDGDDE